MSDSIRAVERALDVLLCFSEQSPELSMTQIADLVGMHKSTVHRLLLTLERNRFVQRDPVSGIYKPGIRLVQLAYLTLENDELRQLAEPYLRRLMETHRETVDLSVLDGDEVVYTTVVETSQRVKIAAVPGQRLPAFCTASGKSFLAFMPEEEVRQILEHGVHRYTCHTVLDSKAIFDELSRTRERGFAISEQEYEDGIVAVSAPILDPQGKPAAVIAIAGPNFRIPHERILEIGPSVVSTAQQIAHERWKPVNNHHPA